MSALDDMMKSGSASPEEGADDEAPGSLESAVKAFFDAASAGDFKEASACLRDAITLADGDDGPESESEPEPMHHALLLMPKGKH
jgi:hypothetical protein